MVNRILRLPEVKAANGVSRSTVYNRVDEGLFPKPVQLGPRMVGWPESEVVAVNAALIRGASSDEMRTLVSKLEADRKKAA